MKVFVAGASGAIGKPAVRQLVAAGHEVTGMTRREERLEEIRAAGATPVKCDVFSVDDLEKALHQAEPEVVVHLLTALPPRIDYKAKEDPLAPTNRVRTEGTRNLLAAAKAAGARRVVAESVAFFYTPEGDWVKGEDEPLNLDAPGVFGTAAAALAEMEREVLGAEGMEGVVLRYGWLYGPDTFFASDGSSTEDAHKRKLPIVGKGGGTFSFLHVDDAASATVAAVERGAPGTYNVVDDEPAPMRDWVPVFCDAVGAKKPMRVPVWLARLIAGKAAVGSATQLRGASNAKAKRDLGWQPRYPSWRGGFADPAARG
jgi:nucleoside-diphosphate-sugar epimerase